MTATMKKAALTLGASLLAISVGASAYVHAQDQNTNGAAPPFRGRGMGPGGPGRAGGPMGMLPMLGRLGLTDAQKDQLKTIAATHADEWKSLANRGRTAQCARPRRSAADPHRRSEVAAQDDAGGDEEEDVRAPGCAPRTPAGCAGTVRTVVLDVRREK
jgi:Spy/CpxP family protein refolding chaperone